PRGLAAVVVELHGDAVAHRAALERHAAVRVAAAAVAARDIDDHEYLAVAAHGIARLAPLHVDVDVAREALAGAVLHRIELGPAARALVRVDHVLQRVEALAGGDVGARRGDVVDVQLL